jgi:FKBP-type peptidyl-prolyl cis-trans isomerase FklB
MRMKLLAVTMGLFVAGGVMAADVASLKTEMDKLSYSIGVDLGGNFKKQGIEVAPVALAAGLQDALQGGKLQLSEAEMKSALTTFQKDLMAKRAAEFTRLSDENKKAGEAFLATNKGKAGVVTLPSGLQYKIVTEGKGAKPMKEETVTVEYTGHLINGTVFDSTEKAGKPATFKLTQVIPGWTEVLQLMPVGSTWEVYIPSQLAYGQRSVGGAIGPNETLIFNIHLLSAAK